MADMIAFVYGTRFIVEGCATATGSDLSCRLKTGKTVCVNNHRYRRLHANAFYRSY
jgi:hypothetical protein